jgi:hypothetical protein
LPAAGRRLRTIARPVTGSAALLTLYTGFDYFQAGLKHLIYER